MHWLTQTLNVQKKENTAAVAVRQAVPFGHMFQRDFRLSTSNGAIPRVRVRVWAKIHSNEKCVYTDLFGRTVARTWEHLAHGFVMASDRGHNQQPAGQQVLVAGKELCNGTALPRGCSYSPSSTVACPTPQIWVQRVHHHHQCVRRRRKVQQGRQHCPGKENEGVSEQVRDDWKRSSRGVRYLNE